VDADTFRSWPALRSRPLLSPFTDVEASGVPRLVSKTCTRKIGCYTRCESLRKKVEIGTIPNKYRLPDLIWAKDIGKQSMLCFYSATAGTSMADFHVSSGRGRRSSPSDRGRREFWCDYFSSCHFLHNIILISCGLI